MYFEDNFNQNSLNMNNLYAIIFIAFFSVHTEGSFAQNRFKASLMAGLNMAQIKGDLQDGYKKKGASLGLIGSMILSPDFDICTELLYNEKGAAPGQISDLSPRSFYSNISLKYSEMSLLAHYFFKPLVEQNYYQQSIKIGVSYGRLLKSETSISQNNIALKTIEQTLAENYNTNDFSFVAAWSFYFSRRLSISLRHSNSLNFLFKNHPSIPKGTFQNMRPDFFSIHFTYDFIAPKKVLPVRKRRLGRADPLEELY
jgi:Outer membrane protein beta-barrel domain